MIDMSPRPAFLDDLNSPDIPLKWHVEQHRLECLVPLEKNPFGKIDAKKKKRLEEKIKTLGVFETATIDSNGVLLTWNKRRAILMELGYGQELFNVMAPNRQLTEKERKEIILASNIHEGSWINEILQEEYADIDLVDMGLDMAFNDAILAEVEKNKSPEQKKSDEPVYPIVAKFSEKHDAIMIISDNEIDTNFLKQVLGLEKSQSYKSEAVGQSLVISAQQFIQAWNQQQKAQESILNSSL